jgi:hypothetical protein
MMKNCILFLCAAAFLLASSSSSGLEVPFADPRLNKIKLLMRKAEVEKTLGQEVRFKGNAALLFDSKVNLDESIYPSLIRLNKTQRVNEIHGRAADHSEEAALAWLKEYGNPILLTSASELYISDASESKSAQYAICISSDVSLYVSFVRRIYKDKNEIPTFHLTQHNGANTCLKKLK